MTIDFNSEVISPIVYRHQYFIENVDETSGILTLMDLKGNTRADIKLCNETEADKRMNKKIKEALRAKKEILVSVLSAIGYDKITSYKIL